MALTILPVFKERVSTTPYAILAVLQILDVMTTGWILHHFSSAAEGNPIVAALFNTTGLYVGLTALLAFKLGMVYLLWSCQTGTKIANSIYLFVITNNILFLFLWATS